MPLRAFMRLSRLHFLAGGVASGALGTVIAARESGRFEPAAYALAQATITSFHLMTHYANDYFDRHSDVTNVRTRYSGGSGALIDGSLIPSVALRSAAACAALGALGSIALVATGTPAAGAAALTIGLGAWTYSAPPLRLAARGLGELDSALVVAVLVPLCAFLAQGAVLDSRFVGSVLPGAVAMVAMMLAVEFPDAAADAQGGKRNLVVRLGALRARFLGIGCVLATFVAFGAALSLGAPHLYAATALLTVPAAFALGRAFWRWQDADHGVGVRLARSGVVFFFLVTFFGVAAHVGTLFDAHGATVAGTAAVR